MRRGTGTGPCVTDGMDSRQVRIGYRTEQRQGSSEWGAGAGSDRAGCAVAWTVAGSDS